MARLDVIPALLLDAGRVLRSASVACEFEANAGPEVGELVAQAHQRFVDRIAGATICAELEALAVNVEVASLAYDKVDGSIARRSNGTPD